MARPAAGRPPRRPVEASLKRAALAAVARDGSRGATTRRIANLAGVSEVTLFRHFASKEALILAALERLMDARAVPPLPAVAADPQEELWVWLRAQQRLLRRHRRILRTCLGEFDAFPAHAMLASRWFADGVVSLRDYLASMNQGAAGWDPQAAALFMMGALVSDTLGRDIMPKTYDLAARRTLCAYLDLLLRAIRPNPA